MNTSRMQLRYTMTLVVIVIFTITYSCSILLSDRYSGSSSSSSSSSVLAFTSRHNNNNYRHHHHYRQVNDATATTVTIMPSSSLSSSPSPSPSPSPLFLSNKNDDDNRYQQIDNNNSNSKSINVVIAGGGIIGTSIAYYLMKLQNELQNESSRDVTPNINTVTIIDPTGTVGSCASGKAGGFLAKDWRDNTPTQQLHRYGFELHQELATEFASISSSSSSLSEFPNKDNLINLNNPTDYRRLTCAAVAVDETIENDDNDEDPNNRTQLQTQSSRIPNKPPSKKLLHLDWVNPDVVLWDNENDDDEDNDTGGGGVISMGDETTIAQVHPRKLCETMWKQTELIAGGNGRNNEEDDDEPQKVKLLKGRIVQANTHNDNEKRVESVELEDGTIVPADVLIIACGPWTYEANTWFDFNDGKNNNNSSSEGDENNDIVPEITSIKCHSILVHNTVVQSQAIFFDSNGAIGEDGDLEVYPRLDGDLYVNGFQNEEGVCIEKPNEEVIEQDKIELLRDAMDFVYKNNDQNSSSSNISSCSSIGDNVRDNNNENDNSSVHVNVNVTNDHHTEQVCYWPETPDGIPIIGNIPNINGVYVAGKFFYQLVVSLLYVSFCCFILFLFCSCLAMLCYPPRLTQSLTFLSFFQSVLFTLFFHHSSVIHHYT